jgi:hypothetical protein
MKKKKAKITKKVKKDVAVSLPEAVIYQILGYMTDYQRSDTESHGREGI